MNKRETRKYINSMNTSYLNILKVILKVHAPLWYDGFTILQKWGSGQAWIVLPHKDKVAILLSKHYAIKNDKENKN